MEKTIIGTPQQNGVAEHKNMTFNEQARYMRLHDELSSKFWTYIVNTTVYLINHGQYFILDCRLPKEVGGEMQ